MVKPRNHAPKIEETKPSDEKSEGLLDKVGHAVSNAAHAIGDLVNPEDPGKGDDNANGRKHDDSKKAEKKSEEKEVVAESDKSPEDREAQEKLAEEPLPKGIAEKAEKQLAQHPKHQKFN